MKETLTVFVSGPMSGLPELNYPEFNRVAKLLRANGYNVVNPAEIGIHNDWSWEDYMKVAIMQLINNDVYALVMLDGWEDSRGACIEHDLAKSLGKEILELAEIEWILGGEAGMDNKNKVAVNLAASLSDVEKSLLALNTYLSPHKVDVNHAYERAVDLLHNVNILVDKLEEQDENLDLEKTKIPSIDQYFEGNPVTEYVNASFDFIKEQTLENQDRLVEAANKVKETQLKEDFNDEDVEIITLLEYIKLVDTEYAEELRNNLDMIEEYINGLESYSADDLELIRYYLKHLPNNSDHDIEMLSDRAVELAWKRKKMIEGK